MDGDSKKRKAGPEKGSDGNNKRAKGKKQWNMPRKDAVEARSIMPGDMGIWATCSMKKEGKSVGDLRDLFQGYAEKLYGNAETAEDDDSDAEGDIEAQIQNELSDIRKPAVEPLFTSVKLDTQCLLFFKTRAPVEPVSFVQKICQDAADGVPQSRCTFVKRLTPITGIEKATEKGLDELAKRVLAPHFHVPGQETKKFAIRPSIRNNKEFTRDKLIKTVAAAVGRGHTVDLSDYDLLIIVEIYKNVIGMSVVGPEFEKLKRFNISELRDVAADVKEDTTKAAADVKEEDTSNAAADVKEDMSNAAVDVKEKDTTKAD